ncbi:hypothetical protein J4233_00535 [Candidatus Pacearchaeota archaeon]|nr:hypothetical protein [Candidatus Pacearchaeota archaeon]
MKPCLELAEKMQKRELGTGRLSKIPKKIVFFDELFGNKGKVRTKGYEVRVNLDLNNLFGAENAKVRIK